MAAGVVGLSLRDALSSPQTPPPSAHLPQATSYPCGTLSCPWTHLRLSDTPRTGPVGSPTPRPAHHKAQQCSPHPQTYISAQAVLFLGLPLLGFHTVVCRAPVLLTGPQAFRG